MSIIEAAEQLVIKTVRCPDCTAAIGEHCRTNYRNRSPHTHRVQAFEGLQKGTWVLCLNPKCLRPITKKEAKRFAGCCSSCHIFSPSKAPACWPKNWPKTPPKP